MLGSNVLKKKFSHATALIKILQWYPIVQSLATQNASSGNLLEMQKLGPSSTLPGLLNQICILKDLQVIHMYIKVWEALVYRIKYYNCNLIHWPYTTLTNWWPSIFSVSTPVPSPPHFPALGHLYRPSFALEYPFLLYLDICGSSLKASPKCHIILQCVKIRSFISREE